MIDHNHKLPLFTRITSVHKLHTYWWVWKPSHLFIDKPGTIDAEPLKNKLTNANLLPRDSQSPIGGVRLS